MSSTSDGDPGAVAGAADSEAGMVRICCHCGRAAGADGIWQILNAGRRRDSKSITHGICPVCLWRCYPDLASAVQADSIGAEEGGVS